MGILRFIGLVLIVAGIVALGVGHFSYTKATHQIKLGPIELAVKETQDVELPIWAGMAAIAVGGALMVLGGRKR
ncbi:MAG TPA: hypothetical protein VGI11_14135 [Variovorax sp.]